MKLIIANYNGEITAMTKKNYYVYKNVKAMPTQSYMHGLNRNKPVRLDSAHPSVDTLLFARPTESLTVFT
ncbi:hypothetical protein CSV79_05440 [Sporosarcina sp. P13]|nr:hypothetical protein CSV79_05440 [Sporosarcina sp. P13]